MYLLVYYHYLLITKILAALPEFEDHHIIAVNPIGWHGTTMEEPIDNHEENAESIKEFLDLLGVEKAIVAGYSTGRCTTAYAERGS